jgi:tetratricopeptide (TPR) repeat protein
VLSSGGNPQSGAHRRHAKQTAQTRHATQTAQSGSKNGRTATTATASPQQAAPPPPAPPPAVQAKPASSAAATPSQLNDRGYALLRQQRYAEAVTPLQASVAGYREAGERGLPFAFALYNLAVALNHSGNSSAAIPLLRERLGYDNQRAKVVAELRDAQAKAGVSSGTGTGTGNSAGTGSSNGAANGNGNGNGAGGAKPGKRKQLKTGNQGG